MADYTRRLTSILLSCPESMSSLAESTGLSKGTLYTHWAWLRGKEWGRRFAGRISSGKKSAITKTAKRCIPSFSGDEELPYRETEDAVRVFSERQVEHTATLMGIETGIVEEEEKEEITYEPVKYRYWETELVWYGKHGGTDQRTYSEEFTASTEFRLPQRYSQIDANKVGQELLDRALDNAGYPDISHIVNVWHTEGMAIGTREKSSAPSPPRFGIEQTDSGVQSRRNRDIRVPGRLPNVNATVVASRIL